MATLCYMKNKHNKVYVIQKFGSTMLGSHNRQRPFKASTQALDLEWLSDRCSGDSTLMRDVLSLFSDQCARHLDALIHALDTGCGSKAVFHTEFLVGAAKNVGASDLCLQTELLFKLLSQKIAQNQALFMPSALNKVSVSYQRCLDYIAVSKSANFTKNTVKLLPESSTPSQSDEHIRRTSSGNFTTRSSPAWPCRRSSTTSDDFGLNTNEIRPTSEKPSSRHAEIFYSMRCQLEAMRQHNYAGRMSCAQAEAFALAYTASGAGHWQLAAAAARAGTRGRYIGKQAMDELEALLDSAAAHGCRSSGAMDGV